MMRMAAIRQVVVLGAGTMGGGIAAHLTNLGFKVSILDVSQAAVQAGFDRTRTAKPAAFYAPSKAEEIRLGNTTDHLAWISEADWIIEAVSERPAIKAAVYEAVSPHVRPDAFLTTNTSGLEIGMLAATLPANLQSRFLGTHFFNPPRYLKLLELIPHAGTDSAVTTRLHEFLETQVARRVVRAKDTPGFIANRFGMWSMYHAIRTAEKLHLTVEQVDAITGPFLGRPKSGSFRLADIVGLDVMDDIGRNLIERCTNDSEVSVLERPASVSELIGRGWIGEKVGQGYYRREGSELLAFDLTTHAYRQRQEPVLPSLTELGKLPLVERLRAAIQQRDEVGEYLRLYLEPLLAYATKIAPEISHSVLDFDRVMQWGFGWQLGPFELADVLIPPAKWYSTGTYLGYSGENHRIPEPEEYRKLEEYPLVDQTETLKIRDLGDGVLAASIATRAGVVTPNLLTDLVERIPKHRGRWVLSSETPNFSVGFDLKNILAKIDAEAWTEIDEMLAGLQAFGEFLETQPIVAAVSGYCFGGGYEVAFSCPLVVADAESKIGLPETKVGLIPGGRGSIMVRRHNQSNAKRLVDAAMTVTLGEVSASADHARTLGYLRPDDVTSYHPDKLIYTAKQAALGLQIQAAPAWAPVSGPVVGMIDQAQQNAKKQGQMTDYDELIGDRIKRVMAKSPSYESAVAIERECFLDLCQRNFTVLRIRHMLEHKTALRN
jgi:3-hydroxyacyl-CoA dehydrogenase